MLLAYKTLAWKWNPARCDLDTHRDSPLSDRVADYGNEAYATSWLAAQVVRQPEGPPLADGGDLALGRSLAP